MLQLSQTMEAGGVFDLWWIQGVHSQCISITSSVGVYSRPSGWRCQISARSRGVWWIEHWSLLIIINNFNESNCILTSNSFFLLWALLWTADHCQTASSPPQLVSHQCFIKTPPDSFQHTSYLVTWRKANMNNGSNPFLLNHLLR